MALRYAKAAGGNWTAAATWSATGSAGVDSAGVPTSSDDVIFELASGAVTIDATATCKTLDCTAGTGSYTGTLTHNTAVTLTVAGLTFKLASGMTYTLGNTITSALTFTSTSGTTLITSAGKTVGSVTFNSTGGTFQPQDSMTMGTTATLRQDGAHTLTTNNLNHTWGNYNAATGSPTLTLGSSTITILNGASSWSAQLAGLTLNAGTSTISISATSGTPNFGSKTYNNITWAALGGSSPLTISGAFTCANLSIANTAIKGGIVAFANNPTITTLFTITGQSLVNRIWVNSSVPGTTITITAASVSLANMGFSDITGAGAAVWSGASIENALGNSNITFTPAVTRYFVNNGTTSYASTSSWSTSSGGASGASVPLVHDTVVFDTNSFSSAVHTFSMDIALVPALDFTNLSQTPQYAFGIGTHNVFGSLVLKSGMAFSSTNNTLNLRGRGSHTFGTTGATLNSNSAFFNAPGGTYTLANSVTGTGAGGFRLDAGTLTTNNNAVTATAFSLSNTNITKTLNMGSSTFTLTGTGIVWSGNTTGAGTTINAGTSTIVISDTSSTAKTFSGQNQTYNALSITGGGTGAVAINNSNTFNGTFTVGAPKTVTFASTTTTTFAGAVVMTGSAGNVITLQASIATSRATLTSTSSGFVQADYLNIIDSAATGGAGWYAGNNSTNSGNNTGWVFTNPPVAPATVAGAATATASIFVIAVVSGSSSGAATATVAITAQTGVSPGAAAAAGAASGLVTWTPLLAGTTTAGAATTSSTVTAPTTLAVATVAGAATATASVTAQTAVAPSASPGSGTSTLTLTAATVVAVAASSGAASASTLVSAQTQIAVSSTAGASVTSTLVTAAAALTLTPAAAAGSGSTSVTSAPAIAASTAGASAASSSLTARTTVVVSSTAAVAATANAVTAPTAVVMQATAAGSASTSVTSTPSLTMSATTGAASTVALVTATTYVIPTTAVSGGGDPDCAGLTWQTAAGLWAPVAGADALLEIVHLGTYGWPGDDAAGGRPGDQAPGSVAAAYNLGAGYYDSHDPAVILMYLWEGGDPVDPSMPSDGVTESGGDGISGLRLTDLGRASLQPHTAGYYAPAPETGVSSASALVTASSLLSMSATTGHSSGAPIAVILTLAQVRGVASAAAAASISVTARSLLSLSSTGHAVATQLVTARTRVALNPATAVSGDAGHVTARALLATSSTAGRSVAYAFVAAFLAPRPRRNRALATSSRRPAGSADDHATIASTDDHA